jgi:RimJ/RimL family protein N-acetyltransferase
MSGLTLIAAADSHLAWMLGEADAPDPLTIAPGGVDNREGLIWTRNLMSSGGPTWLIVDGGEIVGLFCQKSPPDKGTVEVGYRIDETRRGKGYASAALALAVEAAIADPDIRRLVAETLLDNASSHAVLRRNGFTQMGRRTSSRGEPLLFWARWVRPRLRLKA